MLKLQLLLCLAIVPSTLPLKLSAPQAFVLSPGQLQSARLSFGNRALAATPAVPSRPSLGRLRMDAGEPAAANTQDVLGWFRRRREKADFEETPSFMRLVRTGDRWFELQCATVSYRPADQKDGDFELEMFPMVHLADPIYYRQLQEAASAHDRVLFELITSNDCVDTDSEGRKRLNTKLYPPKDQIRMAREHGLQAQMEALDYSSDKWYLADLDKDTIQDMQWLRAEGGQPDTLKTMMQGWGSGNFRTLPESCRTLIRNWLRAPVWLVPCPEGAMLTLDWALSSRGKITELLTTMLDSVLRLDFRTIKKLSFAQLLVSGAQRCDGAQSVIIQERNEEALAQIALAQSDGCGRAALLYGGLHAPDLDEKLRSGLGMRRSKVKWMTAWRIAVPEPKPVQGMVQLGLLASAYLMLDGLDWIMTISGVAEEVADGAANGAMIIVLTYLLRHAVLYSQIGRWLVAWDRPLFMEAASQLEDTSGIGSPIKTDE